MAIVAIGGTASSPTSETFQDVVAVSIRPYGTGTSAVDFTAKSTEFKFGDEGADFETEPTLAGGLLRKLKPREASEHTVKLYTITPTDTHSLMNRGTVAGTTTTGAVVYPTLERKHYRLSVLYSEEDYVSAESAIAANKKALRHVWRHVEITKCEPLNEDKNLYGVQLTFKTQPFNMGKPSASETSSTYYKNLLEYIEYFDGTTNTEECPEMGDFDGTNG